MKGKEKVKEREEKMAEAEDKRKVKKRRRFRLGTMALPEIHKFQKSTHFLIKKLPFMKWVREVTQEQWGVLQFQELALLALQEVAEAYIINLFEDAYLCAIHAKHVTLMPMMFNWLVECREDTVKYLPN